MAHTYSSHVHNVPKMKNKIEPYLLHPFCYGTKYLLNCQFGEKFGIFVKKFVGLVSIAQYGFDLRCRFVTTAPTSTSILILTVFIWLNHMFCVGNVLFRWRIDKFFFFLEHLYSTYFRIPYFRNIFIECLLND